MDRNEGDFNCRCCTDPDGDDFYTKLGDSGQSSLYYVHIPDADAIFVDTRLHGGPNGADESSLYYVNQLAEPNGATVAECSAMCDGVSNVFQLQNQNGGDNNCRCCSGGDS
ncbi:hypothetical protein TeGR_g15272, partial [Tetraparma gracilis]